MKTIIYNKLLLQAEEAKEQGFNKLASGILRAIGSEPEDVDVDYEYEELHKDVYESLWQLVNNIIEYHDLESVNAEKLDAVIDNFASDFIEQIESVIGTKSEESEEYEESDEKSEDNDEELSFGEGLGDEQMQEIDPDN